MNKKLLSNILFAVLLVGLLVGCGAEGSPADGTDDAPKATEEPGEDADVKFCVQTPEEAEDGLYYSLPLGREDTVKADDGTLFTVLCNAASGTATVTEIEEEVDLDCVDDIVHVGTSQEEVFAKAGETKQVTIEGVTVEVTCIGTTGNFSQPVFISDNRDDDKKAETDPDDDAASDDDESEDADDDQASGDITCESLGEEIPFDVRNNMDTGDPNDDVWTITNANNKGKGNVQFVIPPTYNVDMEGDNPRGEYAFIADGLEAALCLADKMWDDEAIRVLVGSQEQDGWLTSRDLDEIDGWDHLEVTRFNQIAIEVEGVAWNPVPFDGKSTFGGDENWHLVQHWDGFDSSDVYGGVIAPNWVLTIPSNWEGTDFIVELLTDSVDLARLWSRFHQMEAVDVYHRDEKPKITMFFCGPDGEEREDFERTLPDGWTCEEQD